MHILPCRLRTAARAAVLAAALLVLPALPARAQGFRVIVNSSNGVTALKRDELSRLLLKKTTTWKAGGTVRPIEPPLDAPTRKLFSKVVHGRDVDAIKSYWQQQIFSGRATPPPERAKDADIIAFVRATPGAIGYVSTETTLPADVRAVDLIP